MAIPANVLTRSIPIYYKDSVSNPNSKSLIVALTSHGGSGIMFAYEEVLSQYDKAHMLFLSSEIRNGYYINGGLSNAYPDLASVMTVINDIITDKNITDVVFVGEGSGGTGAIYYGWEMAKTVDTSIIAFAPYNSISAANWDLAADVCSIGGKASLPYAKNFTIYHDTAYPNEVARSTGLGTYFTIVAVDGGQHLSKVAYKTGRLFQYFDNEINAADAAVTVSWSGFTEQIWNVDHLILHQEEDNDRTTKGDSVADYLNNLNGPDRYVTLT